MPWCNLFHVTSWSLLFGAAHLLFCWKSFQPLCLQVFFRPPTNPQDSSYSYISPFDHLSPRYFHFFRFLSLCISFWIVSIVVSLSSFIHLFFCNVDSTVKLIQCIFLLTVFYEIQFGWLAISHVANFLKTWNNSNICVNSELVSMIDILLIVSYVFLPGNLSVLDIVNFILLGVEYFLIHIYFLGLFLGCSYLENIWSFQVLLLWLVRQAGAVFSPEQIIYQLLRQDLPEYAVQCPRNYEFFRYG